MRVALISPYENVCSYGIRSLSAVLKAAGHSVTVVFLPRETEGLRWEGFLYPFSEQALADLAETVRDCDLIGLTVMSNYLDNAVQITRKLRQATRAPILWGGIHPTIRPEDCLEHADLVCVGEGEGPILDLADCLASGRGVAGIDNIWHKVDGNIVRMPLRPLAQALDSYPHPDYDLSQHFVLHDGHIRPMTETLLMYYLRWPYTSDSPATYSTMMSRGCTYNCTYCCNNALRRVYQHQWRVRRRSVDDLMDELVKVTRRFPGIQWITIEDDVFLADVNTLREFASRYKEAIGLPLFVTGFQPSMVDEERVSLLIGAGMRRARVGIQTGNMRCMHEVYRRPTKEDQLARTFSVMHQFSDRMEPPMYDIIIDNPWETEDELLETIRMFVNVPKPYHLVLYSLTFFPGTELYDRARREGLVADDLLDVYRKFYMANRRTYANGLFRLLQSQRAPRWMMEFLLKDSVRNRRWVWLPFFLNDMLRIVDLAGAGWRAFLRGDWNAFRRFYRAHLRPRTPHVQE